MSEQTTPPVMTVFHCGKLPNLGTCETCGRSAAGTCQFQVKRRGETETSACGRRFCANCQMTMPVVGAVCMAHARFLGASA